MFFVTRGERYGATRFPEIGEILQKLCRTATLGYRRLLPFVRKLQNCLDGRASRKLKNTCQSEQRGICFAARDLLPRLLHRLQHVSTAFYLRQDGRHRSTGISWERPQRAPQTIRIHRELAQRSHAE